MDIFPKDIQQIIRKIWFNELMDELVYNTMSIRAGYNWFMSYKPCIFKGEKRWMAICPTSLNITLYGSKISKKFKELNISVI